MIATAGALTPGDLAALAEEGDTASLRKSRDRNRSQRRSNPPSIVEGAEPPPVPPLPPKSVSPQPSAESDAEGRLTPQLPEISETTRAAASTPELRISAAQSTESAYSTGKLFLVFLQAEQEGQEGRHRAGPVTCELATVVRRRVLVQPQIRQLLRDLHVRPLKRSTVRAGGHRRGEGEGHANT